MRNPIIAALDVPTAEQALKLAAPLASRLHRPTLSWCLSSPVASIYPVKQVYNTNLSANSSAKGALPVKLIGNEDILRSAHTPCRPGHVRLCPEEPLCGPLGPDRHAADRQPIPAVDGNHRKRR